MTYHGVPKPGWRGFQLLNDAGSHRVPTTLGNGSSSDLAVQERYVQQIRQQQGSGQHGCGHGAGWLGSGAGLAASSTPTPGQAMAKDAVASVIPPLDALLKASTLLLGRQPLPLRVLVGSIVGLLL